MIAANTYRRRFAAFLCTLFCLALLAALPVTASAAGSADAPGPDSAPLAAGFLHSAIIKADGSLWTAGDNAYGQLGTGAGEAAGDGENEGEDAASSELIGEAGTGSSPEFVKVMDGARAVYAGYLTTFAIDEEGMLYGWGWNEGAQLGLGDQKNRGAPAPILNEVVTMDTGRFHSAAVTADGTLWTWGWNVFGQLGVGINESLSAPKEALDNVRSVAVGLQHTMAVKNDNTLWAAGDASYGQLADNSFYGSQNRFTQVMEDVQDVACTAFGTLILKTDGSLWACGYNANGELGNSSFENIAKPEKIASDMAAVFCAENFSAAIDRSGVLWAWGNDDYGQYGPDQSAAPVRVAADVTYAAVGGGHMLFLTGDGVVHAMGNNEKGQLGNSSTENISVPEDVAEDVAGTAAEREDSPRMVTALIVVIVLVVIALFAFLIWRTLKGRGDKKPEAKQPAVKDKAETAEPEKTEKLSDKELLRLTDEMARRQKEAEQAAEPETPRQIMANVRPVRPARSASAEQESEKENGGE